MLAADAELDAGARRAAALRGDAHELADAALVDGLKGVGGQDAGLRGRGRGVGGGEAKG